MPVPWVLPWPLNLQLQPPTKAPALPISTKVHWKIQTHLPYWTLIEDLVFIPSLHTLQGHVLTEASVDAEGQGQALLEPQPLLETSGCCVDVQQIFRTVVVRQGHASHQAGNNKNREREQETPLTRQSWLVVLWKLILSMLQMHIRLKWNPSRISMCWSRLLVHIVPASCKHHTNLSVHSTPTLPAGNTRERQMRCKFLQMLSFHWRYESSDSGASCHMSAC